VPLLFLIVFVDLLGFGLMAPLFPFFGERLGAAPSVITLGIASYSLGQFIATPVWGRLSDAYGRRPIFMVSLVGATISYVLLGLADSVWMLIAARALGGVMAGNVSAAYAYVSDITPPQGRARAMGILGAAFGLGFTLGPALGGFLAGNDPHDVNVLLPSLVAAGLSLLAFLGAWLVLPESLAQENRRPLGEKRTGGNSPFGVLHDRRDLTLLVAVMMLVTLATTMMQSIYPLWASDEYGYGPRDVGLVFFFLGVAAVFCQTVLIGPLTRRFGEKAVAMGGIAFYSVGLLGMSLVSHSMLVLIPLALYGMGAGLVMPSMSSIVSLHAHARERGAVMGAFQASSSLGRILGPAFSGFLFQNAGSHSPFLVGAAVALPALWLIQRAESAGHVEETA
jgi:MFS family permease